VQLSGGRWRNCLEELAIMYHTNGHNISFLQTLTYLANRRTAIRTGQGTQNEQLMKPLCMNRYSIYSYFSPKLRYTRDNKNPSAWNFLNPKPEMTCDTVAIIIRVVLLSPYLRIRAVSLSFIHYNQSHRVYINRRRQYICLIWNQNMKCGSLSVSVHSPNMLHQFISVIFNFLYIWANCEFWLNVFTGSVIFLRIFCYFAAILINFISADFFLYLSCSLIAQVSHLYNSEPSHSGINVSSILGENARV